MTNNNTDEALASLTRRLFADEEEQQQQTSTTDETDDLAQTRADIAKRYMLSDEDRDILLSGTDAATLEKQAQRLFQRTPHNVAHTEGRNPEAKADPMAEFARRLFTGLND